MSTAIERYEQPLALIQSIDDLARLSKQVADSNYYQGTDNAAQASVKLMIARELGLGITSISNIHLVKGKISLGYQILIALVKRSGKYDLRFKERTDERVTIDWFEDGELVGTSKFDMEDAKRAGLSGDNYRKFPVRMLTARAVSDGFNAFAPECAGGALYTEGEIPEDPPTRPIAAPRTQSPSTPSPEETVVEAEVVDSAPEAATSEPSSLPDAQEDAVAESTIDPVEALAAVLKALEPEQRKTVKARTTLLGIKWDAGTPRALVEHFAGDDEGLFEHISTAEQEQARQLEVDRDNGTLDAEALAERKAKQMAAAGSFGES